MRCLVLGMEGTQETGGVVLCHLQGREDHSARSHVLGTEGGTEDTHEAGSIVLCRYHGGEDDSAGGDVLGTDGTQEGSLTRYCLESEDHSSRS